MRLQEKLWDSHRSQLWTVSLSHDLCPQNSSSLPATICSPDLTLPQTFVMWKLAQLSQSKQINFPVFTDFFWTCAYPRSNGFLKTPNKVQECANNNPLITGWTGFAELQMLNAAPPGKTLSRVPGGALLKALASPWPPGPSHSKPQAWSTSGQGDVGVGRVGEEGNLSPFTSAFLNLSLLSRSCRLSHHPRLPTPHLSPHPRPAPNGDRFLKASCRKLWVTSAYTINSPSLPFLP